MMGAGGNIASCSTRPGEDGVGREEYRAGKENKMYSHKKLERIKIGLYSLIEDLDCTYEECLCCHTRRYTNRTESLLNLTIQRLIKRIDKDIERMEEWKSKKL